MYIKYRFIFPEEIIKKYKQNDRFAQFWLDGQVMTDMEPYMPRVTGQFIQLTKIRSVSLQGSGVVCAGVYPMGRFLYYGKKMIDPATGKGPRRIVLKDGAVIYRWRLGSHPVATNEPLHYSNPLAKPEWFEVAKRKNLKAWQDGYRRALINGR